MIISTQLNNHDIINYHTQIFQDKKSKTDHFIKELSYKEQHTETKIKTKKYNQMMEYLTHQVSQEKQKMEKQILRENTLQNISNVKRLNKKIKALEVYQENQEGVKVFFS